MFTQSGKNIIAKFLVGQVPTFASHIAFGCGAVPIGEDNSGLDNTAREHALKFEMFRSKIISRGYANEIAQNGDVVSKIVFTAELPTDDRYEITEIGVFPAEANANAGSADSKTLLKFSAAEPWVADTATEINTITEKLGYALDKVTEVGISNTPQMDTWTYKNAFIVKSDNPGLDTEPRLAKLERPRFLNDSIFMKTVTGNSIQLSGLNIDLSKNSPADLIKVATSVITDNEIDTMPISQTTFMHIDFYNPSGDYYRLTVSMSYNEYSQSGYRVYPVSIGDGLVVGSGSPTLSNITKVKISLDVDIADQNLFWIALDGIRLDNVSSNTATYDLVAYNQIKNYVTAANGLSTYAMPIVKDPNSSNFMEFRFGVGVG